MIFLAAQVIFLACWLVQTSTSTVLPIIDRARATTLSFNQRMLYAHAPPARPDIVSEIDGLVLHSGSGTASDDQRVLQALLYMSTGSLDAAHDIVQRMSLHDAVYVHALLHRLEGKHAGEGGMKGWSNADYWNDQVGSYHPHFPLLCEYILHPPQQSSTTTTTTTTTMTGTSTTASIGIISTSINASERVARFVSQIDQASQSGMKTAGSKQSGWQPSLFLNLCMDGFRYNDEACVAFCEAVTSYEYRLLLDVYCAKCLDGPTS